VYEEHRKFVINIAWGFCRIAFVRVKLPYYVFISRDSLFAVPTFDFNFFIKLPKANKERLIIERNELGQIVHSKVPEIVI
jgi:hypothetical protein